MTHAMKYMNANKKYAAMNAQMFKQSNRPYLVQLVEYATKSKAKETDLNVFQDKVDNHFLNNNILLCLLDSDK